MRTIVVPGGSSGVGLAVAIDASSADRRILIVGRDRDRGERARRLIEAKGSETTFHSADLADPGSVRELASELLEATDEIETLAYHAGVISLERRTTPGGIERTFAVNYLGFYALTELLLPHIIASAPSRIVSVAGGPGIISLARFNFDDPNLEAGYFGPKAALRAALAKVMYTRSLARRLEGSGVVTATYHPGLVRSGLARDLPLPLKAAFSLVNLALPRRSKTGSYLLHAPAAELSSGAFYAHSRVVSFNGRHSVEDEERLVELSAELTGIEPFHAS